MFGEATKERPVSFSAGVFGEDARGNAPVDRLLATNPADLRGSRTAAAAPRPAPSSFLDRNAQFTSLAALRQLTQPPQPFDQDRRRF
jgi:hypothetical protein